MKIIGITGTIGAGKGTIVDYLVENKGFSHFSVRKFLLEEIKKRGVPADRNSMYSIANELRSAYGPSYVTDQLYYRALETGKNCVIESIRTPGEIDSLREKGNFFLIAVDADPKMRFERIKLRQSETDSITFETFLENEKREMSATDPNRQNLEKCIRMADAVVTNDSTVDELIIRVEDILKKIDLGKN